MWVPNQVNPPFHPGQTSWSVCLWDVVCIWVLSTCGALFALGPTPLASSTHHEQRKHGLCHVEAVTPVVIGDSAVGFADGEQEPYQDLGPQNTQAPHPDPGSWGPPPPISPVAPIVGRGRGGRSQKVSRSQPGTGPLRWGDLVLGRWGAGVCPGGLNCPHCDFRVCSLCSRACRCIGISSICTVSQSPSSSPRGA